MSDLPAEKKRSTDARIRSILRKHVLLTAGQLHALEHVALVLEGKEAPNDEHIARALGFIRHARAMRIQDRAQINEHAAEREREREHQSGGGFHHGGR